MKDTRKTKKVAVKTKRGTGPGDCQSGAAENLTITELAVLNMLRRARRAEQDWDAYDQQEAWEFIYMMTGGVLAGKPVKELTRCCDLDQFPVLLAAAMANAEAIRVMSSQWQDSRRIGDERRAVEAEAEKGGQA